MIRRILCFLGFHRMHTFFRSDDCDLVACEFCDYPREGF